MGNQCAKCRKTADNVISEPPRQSSVDWDPNAQPTNAFGAGTPIGFVTNTFGAVGNLVTEDLWEVDSVDSDDPYGGGLYGNYELETPPPLFLRERCGGVSAEVFGKHNPHLEFTCPYYEKPQHLRSPMKIYIKTCPVLRNLPDADLDRIVDACPLVEVPAGESIVKAGDIADCLYVVLEGEIQCFREGADATDPRGHLVNSLSMGQMTDSCVLLWEFKHTMSMYARQGSSTSLARLGRDVYQNVVVEHQRKDRQKRFDELDKVKVLDSVSDEALAKLVDAIKIKTYAPNEVIIRQGEPGYEFFIMVSGETVATVETGWFVKDVQEHRRFYAGDLFGEKALMSGEPRAASITAVKATECLVLSRNKFERLLGPLSQLTAENYMLDPRKVCADFYMPGNHNGPLGSLKIKGQEGQVLINGGTSQWFCVYRPTSRDSIAKMLSAEGVGKGLNVKGKSAKKGVLSGFVPFLQISDNNHKDKIEQPPQDARLIIYYRSAEARQLALSYLQPVLNAPGTNIDDRNIETLDQYVPDAYGLNMPEACWYECYVQRADLTPVIGWETGRNSEPAFMDMNLHATRGNVPPKVVVMQWDKEDCMNPRGLLVAYAEKFVKPVVSDFDTFTVGSRGMKYEPVPPEQVELAMWSLNHAEGIFSSPSASSWTSRWLEVLKIEAERGFHPALPKYGFGDPTSYGLISDIVDSSLSCGAVRHGAECFNFYFPQELDAEYLVIWEGFPDKPWDYKSEEGVREFLMQRIQEGFSFPLNPVWPVRDKGWYAVLDALKSKNAEGMDSWYPPESGLLQKIETLHQQYPAGFSIAAKPVNAVQEMNVMEEKDLAMHEVARHAAMFQARNKLTAVTAFSAAGRRNQGGFGGMPAMPSSGMQSNQTGFNGMPPMPPGGMRPVAPGG